MQPANHSISIPNNLWQPLFNQGCQYFTNSTPEQPKIQAAIEQLYAQLVETNAHTNLTRITTAEDFLQRHILDSWTLSPLIPENSCLVDMGTGGGFPAIPLAIIRPDITIVGVDSVAKKLAFIDKVCEQLGLNNLTTCHSRLEDLGHQKDYREQWDMITARGLAALPTLLELTTPCLKIGGQLLAMKATTGWETEAPTAKGALNTLQCRVERTVSVNGDTLIGIITKTGNTPKAYPRGQNLPRKKPITSA